MPASSANQILTTTTKTKTDRLQKWPIYVALTAPLSLFADCLLVSFQNPDITGTIIVGMRVLYWVVAAPSFLFLSAGFVFISIYLIWQGRWKRATSYVLLPLIVIC